MLSRLRTNITHAGSNGENGFPVTGRKIAGYHGFTNKKNDTDAIKYK
jgi:hypothetical protein